MFWQALLAVRDLGRLYEIASVLIRYGFGGLVRRIGLENALERAGRVLRWHDAKEFAHLPPPARARRALEELGPTFIKLGQVLATRVDLFEPEWIAEFGKLQDSAPAAPWEAIREQLIEDLGGAPDEVFAEFDPEPIAAASIAQVYRARLIEGGEVIVKVRRPGIRPLVEADLRWLSRLAEIVETDYPDLRVFHPRDIVRQFTQSLRRELDFASECRNAERIAANFVGYTDKDSPAFLPGEEPLVVIPRIHWPWTGERVCVQELIRGIPGRDLAAMDAAGLDRDLIARRGAHAVLKMILEDGFFHADPHPGNVFYLPGNRLAFIDFGMIGRLTESRRDQLVQLMFGMVRHEPRRVADVLLGWAGNFVCDEENLLLEIETFVDQYRDVPLKKLKIGEMFSDLVGILRQHQLALPPDLTLLVKAFVTLEGMGRELAPDFDMASEALPLLEKALRARYTPTSIAKRGWQTITEMLDLAVGLPQDLSRLLHAARNGRLELHIDVTHLKRVGNQLDNAANRLTVGVVVAALIIGSSIVMTVPGGPTLFGLPAFGLFGFLGAGLGGAWLLLSIWRSGRANRQ